MEATRTLGRLKMKRSAKERRTGPPNKAATEEMGSGGPGSERNSTETLRRPCSGDPRIDVQRVRAAETGSGAAEAGCAEGREVERNGLAAYLAEDVIKAITYAHVDGEIGQRLPLVVRIRLQRGFAQAVHRELTGISSRTDFIGKETCRGRKGNCSRRRVSLVELNAAN